MALEAGTRLGPYEILSPIGAGGMGEVYRAKDTRLDREVAIKVLPANMTKSQIALVRFRREAHAIAVLTHPNIPAVYDVGTYDHAPFLVMELLEGETLRKRLQGERITWRLATKIALAIADGLRAAHAKGIVHRDLKPENILLGEKADASILDFGLAKLDQPRTAADEPSDSTVTISTNAGTILGTIYYMSPEQARGEKADHRSDIYSLGSILYEMLTSHPAFRRNTAAESIAAILHEDIPPLDHSIPAELRRIVTRCLKKDRLERFQSAGDLALALTDVERRRHPIKRARKLCVCGRSQSLPLCDGSHTAEGWTCSHEAERARLGFCSSNRYDNLALKLAARYEGALFHPGEPWPNVEQLVAIVDGTDLEFPTTALRGVRARERIVFAFDVDVDILRPAVGTCRVVGLGKCSLFDAYAKITAILDGHECARQEPSAPIELGSAFISHAVQDEPMLMPVVTYLRRYFQADLFVCADSIQPGSGWHDTILDALRDQDRFIALLSKISLASHFCSFEMGAANALSKPIALISLDGSVPPVFVQHIQAIDLPRILLQESWLDPQDALLRELLNVLGSRTRGDTHPTQLVNPS